MTAGLIQFGETFAAAPADAAPRLTAEQAFARHRQRNGAAPSRYLKESLAKLGLLPSDLSFQVLSWVVRAWLPAGDQPMDLAATDRRYPRSRP